MADDLKNYDVEINGIMTTLRLSDADAKAQGLLVDKPKGDAKAEPAGRIAKARAPRNKARGAENK